MGSTCGVMYVEGKGYGPGAGPGAGVNPGGRYGPGGSYGGVGLGAWATNVYGSFEDPREFGSGGAAGQYADGLPGGAGGGAIRLQAQRLQVDGVITADGQGGGVGYSYGGGGSGGSIRLKVVVLAGGGMIHANGGGNLYGSGGGGGRVAIMYGDRSGYNGTVKALGGSGWGGAGTVYWKKDSDTCGELIVDNGGAGSGDWSTPVRRTGPLTLGGLTIGGGAHVDLTNALTMTELIVVSGTNNTLRVGGGSVLGNLVLGQSNRLDVAGSMAVGDVVVSNGAALGLSGVVTGGSMTVSSGGLLVLSGVVTGASLSVSSGGVLSQTGAVSAGWVVVGTGGTLTAPAMAVLDLTVAGALTVASNGVIDTTGKGYSVGQGPGTGRSSAGGSYGGVGSGGYPTNVYGDLAAPAELGSGGGDSGGGTFAGGGAGGGAVRLLAQWLQNDGVIAADGLSGAGPYYGSCGGGGAGGSILLTVGQFSGGGLIHANGGVGCAGAGGGRVAIFYGDRSGYGGTVTALGGSGGGAGTVYWKKDSDAYGELVIDNGGVGSGQWSTPITTDAILRLNSFTVAGGARVSTFAGLRVVTGNPASFASLISSNYLQVGSLLVSNTWVFGDVIEPVMSRSNGVPVVTVYCRPQRTYLLLASTNFLYWSSVATFTPAGSSFTFADTNAPSFGRRFFRAVMLDYFFDGIGISMNRTNRQTRLTVSGAQPNHTVVLEASDDLRNWAPIATLIPSAVTNWQFLDTNAPSFQKRFYRAVGQGR